MTAVISHSAGFSVMLWPRFYPLFPHVESLSRSSPFVFLSAPFQRSLFPRSFLPFSFSTFLLSFVFRLSLFAAISSVKFCIRGDPRKKKCKTSANRPSLLLFAARSLSAILHTSRHLALINENARVLILITTASSELFASHICAQLCSV